jgi:L-amino acid N-acyltransferase YncA
LTIRRIRQEDRSRKFRTGKQTFDKDPAGNELNLDFYFTRDQTGYESYVLEENGIILGILCIKTRGDSLYLSRVGIQEGYGKMGNGAQLLAFAVRKAVEDGLRKIELEAQDEVIVFFKNLGFVITRSYSDTYWGNSATMELVIDT